MDLHLLNQLALRSQGKEVDFKKGDDEIMTFWDMICVPDISGLKKIIFEECHLSGLNIHPEATNMYQDLKRIFWWPDIKKNVVDFVHSCLLFQKSKIKHKKPFGLLQTLSIPEWKLDNISMDFVAGFPRTAKGYHLIWVIVDRLTK